MRRRPILVRPVLSETFDLTPIIDVVFLLIIFFILVCRFITAESFEVAVPEQIQSAKELDSGTEAITTVTVMRDEADGVVCAVGSQTISFAGTDTTQLLASTIDERLRAPGADRRRIILRCEKSIPFEYTKQVLDGISQSNAQDVQWAVLGKQ